MFATRVLLCALCAACAIGAARADNINPHDVYESNCARCHAPHAGAFVFETLENRNGVLTGTATQQPVEAYLASGHGGLSEEEIAVMTQLFRDISRSGRLFKRKCAICHNNANDLAHFDLVIRDGALFGRYSGRDIAAFLAGHGRLTPDEIPLMLDVLERQRRIYE